MNANEISPKARMHRIKIVSRITRYSFLAVFLFSVWLIMPMIIDKAKMLVSVLASISTGTPTPVNIRPTEMGYFLLRNLYSVVVCIWYWKLARLFHLYEQGLIFASKTVRCMKILGLLCITGSILKCIIDVPYQLYPQHPPQALPPPVTVLPTHGYRMSFFSFDFGTGVDFGLLLAGITIVLIAWIMDEGRKIQEEQELTV